MLFFLYIKIIFYLHYLYIIFFKIERIIAIIRNLDFNKVLLKKRERETKESLDCKFQIKILQLFKILKNFLFF